MRLCLKSRIRNAHRLRRRASAKTCRMALQNALKNLYELRAVLDRLAQTDSTLSEALSLDVEEAIRLTDDAVAELSQTKETGEI